MATYRLSVYVAKRSEGRSATAMAAYRSGDEIKDERTGAAFDYTRKEGVQFSEIVTPEGAPEWAQDRAELWNRSEAAHKRGDAVIAREIQLSLPHELNDQQRQELTGKFARYLSDRYDVAIDVNIHAPHRDGDERNHHAHLQICTRTFDETKAEGLGNNVRAFDAVAHQRQGSKNEVELWREVWAMEMNDALQRADVRDAGGVQIEVDHRSYERRDIDREPQLKEGVAATAKKRRGEECDRSQVNDEIRERNAERDRMAVQRADVQELNRRQAERMTGEEWREKLPANDNTPAREILAHDQAPSVAPRRAEVLTAPEVQQRIFEPANDNTPAAPTARKAESLTQEQARQEITPDEQRKYREYFNRLPGETTEQTQQRAEKAIERARERERKQQEERERSQQRGRDFGR